MEHCATRNRVGESVFRMNLVSTFLTKRFCGIENEKLNLQDDVLTKEFIESQFMKLRVNGSTQDITTSDDTPLLWVIREELGLTGTKYGCGIAQCGACKVHIDGVGVPSCTMPVADAVGKEVITIEGLGGDGLHPVQQSWIDNAVSQCGYCQPGQIMAAAAFLVTNPNPTEEDVRIALARNLCRCGTYPRIVLAVLDAAKRMRS
jgi:isoquinoline 1-oxidoreductase subunit alpha